MCDEQLVSIGGGDCAARKQKRKEKKKKKEAFSAAAATQRGVGLGSSVVDNVLRARANYTRGIQCHLTRSSSFRTKQRPTNQSGHAKMKGAITENAGETSDRAAAPRVRSPCLSTRKKAAELAKFSAHRQDIRSHGGCPEVMRVFTRRCLALVSVHKGRGPRPELDRRPTGCTSPG